MRLIWTLRSSRCLAVPSRRVLRFAGLFSGGTLHNGADGGRQRESSRRYPCAKRRSLTSRRRCQSSAQIGRRRRRVVRRIRNRGCVAGERVITCARSLVARRVVVGADAPDKYEYDYECEYLCQVSCAMCSFCDKSTDRPSDFALRSASCRSLDWGRGSCGRRRSLARRLARVCAFVSAGAVRIGGWHGSVLWTARGFGSRLLFSPRSATVIGVSRERGFTFCDPGLPTLRMVHFSPPFAAVVEPTCSSSSRSRT